MLHRKTAAYLLVGMLCAHSAIADEEIQDMSDPLAVYTQFGAGWSNKGLNIKVGQAYDTGNPETIGQNLIEFIGGFGESLGWDDNPAVLDNSIDQIRFRNFGVNLTNGRGQQWDVNFALDPTLTAEKSGTVSYSIIQAIPAIGPVQLYPLGGLGVAFGENALEDDGTLDDGYSFQGSFGLVGLYGKITLTEKIWLNYNPFWFSTISGSDAYKDNAYGLGESSILTHEFAASYQMTPRFNIRYFANWNANKDFSDGDHRLEFNYQL